MISDEGHALYRWPEAAALGRAVPKTKFYEHSGAARKQKPLFVEQVAGIVWAYKLAEATVNLAGTPAVPEIQVFRVEAKSDEVSNELLAAIDKSIPSPLIFEVVRSEAGLVRMVAAYKTLQSGKPKPRAYHGTSWVPVDSARRALPTALDLGGLYHRIITPLMPVVAQPGESTAAVAERVREVDKLERDIVALVRRMRTEPQLNRKVELRRELREQQARLDALKSAGTPSEDAAWRS